MGPKVARGQDGSHTGTVVRVTVDRGFCFVKSDLDQRDYFCHFTAARKGDPPLDLRTLAPGRKVRFKPVDPEPEKGPRADAVELI